MVMDRNKLITKLQNLGRRPWTSPGLVSLKIYRSKHVTFCSPDMTVQGPAGAAVVGLGTTGTTAAATTEERTLDIGKPMNNDSFVVYFGTVF